MSEWEPEGGGGAEQSSLMDQHLHSRPPQTRVEVVNQGIAKEIAREEKKGCRREKGK